MKTEVSTHDESNEKAKVYRVRIRPRRTYELLVRLKPSGMSWDLFLYKLATKTFHDNEL